MKKVLLYQTGAIALIILLILLFKEVYASLKFTHPLLVSVSLLSAAFAVRIFVVFTKNPLINHTANVSSFSLILGTLPEVYNCLVFKVFSPLLLSVILSILALIFIFITSWEAKKLAEKTGNEKIIFWTAIFAILVILFPKIII